MRVPSQKIASCAPELLRGERLDEGEDGVVDARQELQEHPVRETQAGGRLRYDVQGEWEVE